MRSDRIRVITIGDSTVATHSPDTGTYGWGQVISEFFNDGVECVNLAKSGRSSKSFILEGSWKDTLTQRPDYLFIQFGHNDCPEKGERETDPGSDYMEYLRRYVDEGREAGATPILVSPLTRRRFGKDGKIRTKLRPYADAMISVGTEREVPIIDLHAKSVELFESLGDSGSADLNCSAEDRTHLSMNGAREMARLVVQDLAKVEPRLAPYLR